MTRLGVLLACSFALLVLGLSGAIGLVTLRSGSEAAAALALRLHRDISASIEARLDDELSRAATHSERERLQGLGRLLAALPIAHTGRALVVDERGRLLASSSPQGLADEPVRLALAQLNQRVHRPTELEDELTFRFDVTAGQPPARETWLARVTPYAAAYERWLQVTAMPESYYLADVRRGNAIAMLLCAGALGVALLGAGLLAASVAAPIRRITAAAGAMAAGDLDQRVPGSRLAEVDALVSAFNAMARQLREAFHGRKRLEETLTGIIGASPAAMAVFREALDRSTANVLEGRTVLRVNAAWERITGHQAQAIEGRSSSLLNLWADVAARRRYNTAMFERRRVAGFEATLLRADGTPFEALMSGAELRVQDECLTILVIVDITARKRADEQLQALNRRMQTLLDAAVEVAIVASDPAGRISVFNHGAQRLLGREAATMLGQPVRALHAPGDLATALAEIATAPDDGGDDTAGTAGTADTAGTTYALLTRDGRSSVRSARLQRADGSAVPVSLAISAVRDEQGATLGYLCIALDISEQLAAQAELLDLNASLDRRVHERTLALETATRQREAAFEHLRQMQAKLVQSGKLAGLGEIVAAVAHELNTPIGNSVTVASTLHGETATIAAELAGGTLRKQRFGAYLDAMASGAALLERSLQQAAQMVSNFKRVAVDQGSEHRRVFDLRGTLEDTLAILKPMLKKTPFSVTLALPDDVQLDSYPGALEQVINHLVSNAVTHAFAGRSAGRMTLGGERDGEQVRLQFADDGIGMDAATVARIHEPFFTTAPDTGGGLGMHIAYNLVTGPLGGEIEVRSAPGQGTAVTLLLPRVAPRSATMAAAAATADQMIEPITPSSR